MMVVVLSIDTSAFEQQPTSGDTTAGRAWANVMSFGRVASFGIKCHNDERSVLPFHSGLFRSMFARSIIASDIVIQS